MKPSTEILSVIDTLTTAINVCHNVDNTSDDHERSYPFAAGYSKAAMQTAIQDLQYIVKRMNNEM